MKKVAVGVLATLILTVTASRAHAAQAAVPQVMGYHSAVYDEGGNPIVDGEWDAIFRITDVDGNLEFLTKDGANVFVNTPSSRLALAKGFSIQSDSTEPDIEAIDTDGTTYSVISGDTDTKGVNGLPTRQGFNFPDIGANPSPLLLSGGSIS